MVCVSFSYFYHAPKRILCAFLLGSSTGKTGSCLRKQTHRTDKIMVTLRGWFWICLCTLSVLVRVISWVALLPHPLWAWRQSRGAGGRAAWPVLGEDCSQEPCWDTVFDSNGSLVSPWFIWWRCWLCWCHHKFLCSGEEVVNILCTFFRWQSLLLLNPVTWRWIAGRR